MKIQGKIQEKTQKNIQIGTHGNRSNRLAIPIKYWFRHKLSTSLSFPMPFQLSFHLPIQLASAVTFIAGSAMLSGCGKSDTTFSILSKSQGFQQAQATVNNKIDILWVIDNSGSMNPLQQNLINNYSSFMSAFQNKGFDFQMAVTASDAYLASTAYRNIPSLARFRDGAGATHSGVYVVTQNDPNALANFMINANQGAVGTGDERVFQSLLETMNSPLNAGFRRPGAFFAVIILSDEDDFSNTTRPEGVGTDHSYTQAGLMSVDSVISQLEAYTSSTPDQRNFNVSAITIKDSACQASHVVNAPSAIIGTRYIELANKTNGILGSVCDASFAGSLDFIQQRIVELTTEFKLSRLPSISTISVSINGAVLAQDATNGWTYSATTNSIRFHGTGVPPAGAQVAVSFDPVNIL